MKILWGIKNYYNDITDICFKNFLINNMITINFKNLSSLDDHLKGINKHIKIYDLNNNYKIFSENEDINIDINTIFIKNIVFYCFNCNGDIFTSRLFINNIINNTINKNINLFFTSPNPNIVSSHCFDLGIKYQNFNKINLPSTIFEYINKPIHLIESNLFINIWVFNENFFNLTTKCHLCLLDSEKYFNYLIEQLNNDYNFSIERISYENITYLEFNYSYYNIDHLKFYILEKKNIYNKIILIYNNNSNANNINFDYLDILLKLSNENLDYLFITFIKEKRLNIKNITSIYDIYNDLNLILPHDYGINYSYLGKYADKIICKDSGPSYFLFNKYLKNKKNTLLWLTNGSPENKCINYFNKFSCLNNYYLEIFIISYLNNNEIFDKINNFIK